MKREWEIAELNFCDLVVNFWRTLCFSMEVLLFMKFIFFGAIHFNGNVFGLLAMNFHISQLGFRYSPSIPSVCATCVVFTELDSLTFLGFFYFIFLIFFIQLFELIWFEFLNLTGCVYLCDFAGQEKWGIRYHICGCGRLKILKSNIKGELRLNFLSRSRQAWF